MDDMGYAITPSPVIHNDNYNRPHSTVSRPANNGYNDYQDDNNDGGNGYNYGSYQGIEIM
jgi:hypothetical protein